jgi:hypothetical protein
MSRDRLDLLLEPAGEDADQHRTIRRREVAKVELSDIKYQ